MKITRKDGRRFSSWLNLSILFSEHHVESELDESCTTWIIRGPQRELDAIANAIDTRFSALIVTDRDQCYDYTPEDELTLRQLTRRFSGLTAEIASIEKIFPYGAWEVCEVRKAIKQLIEELKIHNLAD